jgi:hypothetical protein
MEPPYPLHPSVAARVHPEYAAFYNKYIIDKQQVHLQPVSASRVGGVIIPGGGAILPVGKTEDFDIDRAATKGDTIKVRVFTPEGTAPEAGWSVFLYFHGGGWVLGNIDTENTVCSNVCKRAGVVVVSVDYRYVPSFLVLPKKTKKSTTFIDKKCIGLPQKIHSLRQSTTAGKPCSGYTCPRQLPTCASTRRACPSADRPLAGI